MITDKELRALRQFVSRDVTRPHMTVLWRYGDNGDTTYMATDGHTMIVRRSGTHRTMSPHEIAKLPTFDVFDVFGAEHVDARPPSWDLVLHPGVQHQIAPAYGINPDYFARVGNVERAVGHRAAEDYVPNAGESKKYVAEKKSNLRIGICASWVIPSDPLDAWYWRIDADAALWEGVIMPRRV